MTRIIAGTAKGRRLTVPTGGGTRPTADRVREAMFSTLQSALGSFDGLAVLDVYAGSGALGLESLSRGAAAALFFESDAKAVRILRENVTSSGLSGALVLPGKAGSHAEAGPAAVPGGPVAYDVVFLDPPYALPDRDVTSIVERLARHGWLAPDAVLVLERSSRDAPWTWPEPVQPVSDRRYGQVALWYGRADVTASAGELT